MKEFSKEITRDICRGFDTTALNLKGMAEDMGIPYTTLWYQLKTARRWHVESWLLFLNRLGAARIEGDTIVIKASAVKKLKGKFV